MERQEEVENTLEPVEERAEVRPSGGRPACPRCAASEAGAGGFIYALGQIEPRFPRLGVEKEFAQALGRSDSKGQTDRQALHAALSQRENRYLARQLCWVLSVQGMETYLLEPRDPVDLELLIEAAQPQEKPWIHAVVGTRGPLASAEYCNGLTIPIVIFDQLYSFDHASLIEAIPRPDHMQEDAFRPAAREVFDRIQLSTDNAGATDEHRALNYVAMRYPSIYTRAASAFADNFSLSAVEARPSAVSSIRKVIEIVFTFTNRSTDFTEAFSVRVDVTDEFPFLVTKLSPYYPR